MSAKILFPSESLTPYVEAYYLSSDLLQDNSAPPFPAVSTSYIKLSSVTAVVSGPTTKPTAADSEFDDLTGLGVKLRVGAFYTLFGIPACELTNQVFGLDEILGRTAIELMAQMAEETSPSGQVRCLEQTLRRFTQRDHPGEYLIEQQAVAAMRQLPATPIAQLAQELGYSSRQLQRKLNDFVGLSPRLYKRICRFEKALALIHAASSLKPIRWSELARACGYSDQAHFIRDFHELAGCTPAQYLTSLSVN